MSIPDKALWIVERNFTQSLTLDGIAAACAVSRSHLAHAFGAATGLSVMQYVRARRLSDAARALASGAPHILTVALDAGYNSHEAFTRAFRDRFEETPENVRDRRSLDGLALIDPLKPTLRDWCRGRKRLRRDRSRWRACSARCTSRVAMALLLVA